MGALFGLVFWLTALAALVTHIVACIQAGALMLLVIGTLLTPIGAIHGVMIWLGMSWAA